MQILECRALRKFSPLEFVTYDDRQADAARQAGLKVVQPGR
jgi:hypothetical protein